MRFLKLLAIITAITLIVVLLDRISYERSKEPLYEQYYPELRYMLDNDSIMDILRFWGMDTARVDDWEESANALGIPPEIMTMDMYVNHIQIMAHKSYLRNRAVR